MCSKIPNEMSFDEAASIPITYSTVIHGMIDQGKLSKGMVSDLNIFLANLAKVKLRFLLTTEF